MESGEAGARQKLRKIVEDLSSLRYRLLDVEASVPPSPLETGPSRDEDFPDFPDQAIELRSVIANVLNDRIYPALVDLESLLDLPGHTPR